MLLQLNLLGDMVNQVYFYRAYAWEIGEYTT